MPNRQLQCDCIQLLNNTISKCYMQPCVVISVWKHICMYMCLWKGRNCAVIVLLVHISQKFQMLLKYIP